MYHTLGRALLAVILGCAGIQSLSGQTQGTAPQAVPVPVPDAERHVVTCPTNGTTYHLDVALPRGYAAGSKRYPVLYTLDGNAWFTLATETYRLLQANWILPEELIIVGIGYPLNAKYPWWSQEYLAIRRGDYWPKEYQRPGSRSGDAAFLRCLRDELIPFTDRTYRTIPTDRAVFGHSLSGLFAVYVLTHEPETFQRYAIGSPALYYRLSGTELWLPWESDYASTHRRLPAQVYMYVGGLETDEVTRVAKQFWQRLQSRHYDGLNLVDFATLQNEGHFSENVSAFEHALRSLYARSSTVVSVEVLKRYVGDWAPAVTQQGLNSTYAIHFDGARLLVDVPYASPPPREIVPTSETSFFIREFSGVQLTFTVDPASHLPSELTVTMAGQAPMRLQRIQRKSEK
jgi:hypothetical protein